jgi:hypothetical protein
MATSDAAVHYGVVGQRLHLDPPRWGRTVVEQLVLPDLPRLREAAADEHSIVMRLWHRDQHVRAAKFDVDRFERLRTLADGRLQLHLRGQNRRIMFNVFRSLSLAELRFFVEGTDLDGQGIGQIFLRGTRAIVEYGQPPRDRRLPGQPIRITQDELTALAGPGLEVLARVITLAAMRLQAEISYRRAGKGMRLLLEPSGRPILEDASWVWEPDPELSAAMEEYDARREAASLATPTGLPVRDRQVFHNGAFPWLTVASCSERVCVRYPKLNREHATNGHMIVPVNITDRLSHLADWDQEFTAMFGMGTTPLRQVSRALTNALFSNLALDQLRYGKHPQGTITLTSQLADRNSKAPDYLREVLTEGTLRASRKLWIETLTAPRSTIDEPPSAADVQAFICAFTRNAGGPQGELQPQLFHELEAQTLVLDLTAATEFIDLCYLAVVQGKDGRGRAFEGYARKIITERLGLAPPFPFPPGTKLAKLGLADDEVDFCFRRGNVLVNIDMKARTRSLEIHRGTHNVVRNRVSDFEKALLTRVEPRGRVLAEELRKRGEPVDVVVSLLCTADVEYVPPGPRMRYSDVPRMLTAYEIVDLVLDPVKWDSVVTAARSDRRLDI